MDRISDTYPFVDVFYGPYLRHLPFCGRVLWTVPPTLTVLWTCFMDRISDTYPFAVDFHGSGIYPLVDEAHGSNIFLFG